MEVVKAVCPTVSGSCKSSESYCEWKLFFKGCESTAAFFVLKRKKFKKVLAISEIMWYNMFIITIDS